MVGLFEQRAVGFLDITKAEASEAEFQQLAGLRQVIDNIVLYDNAGLASIVPDTLKPRYLFISDSVVLSAPLYHNQKNLTDGLGIVVIKTIQIVERIIELGHLVRGGISVGNVWHDAENIIGSGYTCAYLTEERESHPRVVLTPAAADVWRAPGVSRVTSASPMGMTSS